MAFLFASKRLRDHCFLLLSSRGLLSLLFLLALCLRLLRCFALGPNSSLWLVVFLRILDGGCLRRGRLFLFFFLFRWLLTLLGLRAFRLVILSLLLLGLFWQVVFCLGFLWLWWGWGFDGCSLFLRLFFLWFFRLWLLCWLGFLRFRFFDFSVLRFLFLRLFSCLLRITWLSQTSHRSFLYGGFLPRALGVG